MRVWSAGATDPVVTTADASGAFTVHAIVPPYDVLVAGSESDLFLGLTRTDPQLARVFAEPSNLTPATTVTGTFGPDAAAADQAHTRNSVLAECPDGVANATYTGAANTYSATMLGAGTSLQGCAVSILRYNTDTPTPTTYGYFSAPATLVIGQSNAINLSLIADETTHDVTIDVSAADGVNLTYLHLYWNAGRHYSVPIAHISQPFTSSPVVAVPEHAKLVAQLVGLNPTSGADIRMTRVLDANTANVTMALGAGVTITAPTSSNASTFSATIDTSQDFTVTGARHQVYVHEFLSSDVAFAVVTTDETLTASVLAARGLALTASTRYVWVVDAYDSVASIDDFTSGRFTGLDPVDADVSYSRSSGWVLQTEP